MIVATRPEPTVRPPSRSDFALCRNLIVTLFAVFLTHITDILPILYAFSVGNVADSYHKLKCFKDTLLSLFSIDFC